VNEYTKAWHAGSIQLREYTRAHWRCEHCGAQFHRGDTRHPTIRNANGRPLILTVHHIDGDKQNNDWTNLLVCCQRCHLHVQAVWKPGWTLPAAWETVPAWITERGLAYVDRAQLKLWG
jgi:hypothetical protein